jgi:hypothetical protein
MPQPATEQEQNAQFEADVRRIASALYPASASGNAEMLMGRERDGIFLTDQLLVVIEATVSRKREKVAADAKKTAELLRSLRTKYPDHISLGIIITKGAPTAEQAEAVKKYRSEQIRIESYDRFRQRLFDGAEYIRCRDNYAFGSAKGQDGGLRLDESKITPLDLIARGIPGYQEAISLSEFGDRFNTPSKPLRAVLVGDFGAGKSTSLHSIYHQAAQRYREGSAPLPLLLNLRDHTGQKNAVEALERHARNIGYSNPAKLVAAFWAGEVSLLLDGFDELAPFAPFSTNIKRIREIRRDSVTLIRDFITRAPKFIPMVITGRSHYFDNDKEMQSSLSISEQFIVYDLNEFTQDQIQDFFKRNGIQGEIPPWLPSRPLLLGYLIQKKILGNGNVFDATSDRGRGWAMLLDEICKREAEVNTNLDANIIKQIVERLATLAGKSAEGLGPIGNQTIYQTWNQLSGADPDTAAQQFLLRLPGLQPADESGDERKFIDLDFAAAARSGDVVRLIETPHSLDLNLWDNASVDLQDLGAEVAAVRLKAMGIGEKRLRVTLDRLSGQRAFASLNVSLIRTASAASISIREPSVTISEAIVDSWTLDAGLSDLSGVQFRGCLIVNLLARSEWEAIKGPKFEMCEILTVAGRSSEADLPADNFRRCVFQKFTAELVSTASIQKLNIPPAVIVLLTIVEKLFFQPGRGRDETAFPRGLDHKLRPLVPELLNILRVSGWASPYRSSGKVIWLPNRTMSSNARTLLSAPTTSSENIIKQAKNLG